jgi:thymidylate kinase
MLPKVIVFTGVDGSGKTTQAKLVVDYFQKKGIAVGFVQQFAPNTLTKSILKNMWPALTKLERNASNKSYFTRKNSDSNQQHFLKSLLRICAVTRIICTGLDHTWIRILLNTPSSVIIFDRYFYDDLIKMKWMFDISDKLEEVLIRLVPKPFLIFYLDVPVEKAWNREEDGNTTLEQHRRKKEIYDNWFEKMKIRYKNFYRVTTEKEKKMTYLKIISTLEKLVGGE